MRKILIAAALAGAAPMLPVTGLSSPAEAGATADAYGPWLKIWSVNATDWMTLRLDKGQLVGDTAESEPSDPYSKAVVKTHPTGRLYFDLAKSTPSRLVGLQVTDSGKTVDLELNLSADGQSWTGFGHSSRGWIALNGRTAQVLGGPTDKPAWEQLVEETKGVWNTPFGRLVIAGKGREIDGRVSDAATGKQTQHFILNDGSREIQEWSWDGESRDFGVTFLLSPDGKTLAAATNSDDYQVAGLTHWVATRYGAAPDPSNGGSGGGGSGGGSSGTPAPSPRPAPEPAPTPVPAGDGSFRQLQKYDVRLDRIETSRDDKLVHVYLTLKNATQSQQYVTSGVVQVQLKDSDGATKQTGQVLRAVAAPPQLFGSTPVLQPGEELKVQFAFHADAGATPSRVIVAEGEKRAEF